MDTLLKDWFASGLAIQLALGVIAIEFVVLLARAKTGFRREKAITLLFALGPGACLMLALRSALIGDSLTIIAAWLAASLPLHLADVARRKL